jgi:pimeloyl-ACP methyl ester carboxylesterase
MNLLPLARAFAIACFATALLHGAFTAGGVGASLRQVRYARMKRELGVEPGWSWSGAWAPDGLTHRHVLLQNGVRLHIAEIAPASASALAPVVLLHGFPEISYTWVHQMLPIAQGTGRRVIVPDLRGYGETIIPNADDVASYDVYNVTLDLSLLLKAEGIATAVVIGHDWGAMIAWSFSDLHPAQTAAVGAIGVPNDPFSKLGTFADWPAAQLKEAQARGPLARLKTYGDMRQFDYMVDFDEDAVEDVFDVLPRGAFAMVYLHADAHALTKYGALALDDLAGAVGGRTLLADRVLLPRPLHDVLVRGAVARGFAPQIAYYRSIDRSWAQIEATRPLRCATPVLIVTCGKDEVVTPVLANGMEASCAQLTRVHAPLFSHWNAHEHPVQTATHLVGWLTSIA